MQRQSKSLGRRKRERILELVRHGTPPHYAHRLAGVNQQTFYQWLARGKDPKSREYHKFVLDLDVALTEWHETLKDLGVKVAMGYSYTEEVMSAQGHVETVQRWAKADAGMVKWLHEKHFASTYAKPKELVLTESDKGEEKLDAKEASETAKKYKAILDDVYSETGIVYDNEENS